MRRTIIHLRETDSTNRYLRELPDDGADMTVVYADFQTAGKGQGSNSWESQPGQNRLMSLRVRPTMVPPTQQFMLRRCIYGIGLNVNQQVFVSDAPNPVSLRQATGFELDVEQVMLQVLDALEEELAIVVSGRFDDIRRRYHQALYRRTGHHAYRDGEGTFMAELVAVEDDGHLVLRDEQGRQRRYAFKEVAFV